MPSHGHVAYREFIRQWIAQHRNIRNVNGALERHAEAIMVLWHLDLEPAWPILKQGYANNPRGGKPWDPVVILRVLCGIEAKKGQPGVGTFYDFMHRINDGPLRKPCEHIERPSEDERRRARAEKVRQVPKEKEREAARTKTGRKALGAKKSSWSSDMQLSETQAL
ncbi:MAG: hypothetical protein V1754_04910 [Pseudomonadota bacterium]